jgi:enoyl-CoA hydratase/carnithine racemase
LRYELKDGVARITLDRPPSNTIDLVAAREWLRAATRCDEDSRVRAVLITGSGSAFSTGGGDVRECSSAREDLPSLLTELTIHLHAAVSRLVRSRAGDRRDPRASGSAYRAPS